LASFVRVAWSWSGKSLLRKRASNRGVILSSAKTARLEVEERQDSCLERRNERRGGKRKEKQERKNRPAELRAVGEIEEAELRKHRRRTGLRLWQRRG